MKKIEIEWKYFFGYSVRGKATRYYKAEVNGLRVERCCRPTKTVYSVGNMDNAVETYKTEELLIAACEKISKAKSDETKQHS